MRILLILAALILPLGPARPDPGSAPARPSTDDRRADMVAECSADIDGELPQGADPVAFCECAVDRLVDERGERAATAACAAELGIAPVKG